MAIAVALVRNTEMSNNVMPPILTDHNCCYDNCPEPGTIHIGVNGGDSHWICWVHYDKWNADRARFLADGGGCAMQRLGELLDLECWD
jgi:hypothetical protein